MCAKASPWASPCPPHRPWNQNFPLQTNRTGYNSEKNIRIPCPWRPKRRSHPYVAKVIHLEGFVLLGPNAVLLRMWLEPVPKQLGAVVATGIVRCSQYEAAVFANYGRNLHVKHHKFIEFRNPKNMCISYHSSNLKNRSLFWSWYSNI